MIIIETNLNFEYKAASRIDNSNINTYRNNIRSYNSNERNEEFNKTERNHINKETSLSPNKQNTHSQKYNFNRPEVVTKSINFSPSKITKDSISRDKINKDNTNKTLYQGEKTMKGKKADEKMINEVTQNIYKDILISNNNFEKRILNNKL